MVIRRFIVKFRSKGSVLLQKKDCRRFSTVFHHQEIIICRPSSNPMDLEIRTASSFPCSYKVWACSLPASQQLASGSSLFCPFRGLFRLYLLPCSCHHSNYPSVRVNLLLLIRLQGLPHFLEPRIEVRSLLTFVRVVDINAHLLHFFFELLVRMVFR